MWKASSLLIVIAAVLPYRLACQAVPASPGRPHGRWVLVSATEDRTTMFDSGTVEELGPRIYRVWFRLRYRVAHRNPSGAWIRTSLHQVEIRCAERQDRLVAFADYDTDGNVLESGEAPGPWGPAVPESYGEEMVVFACARAPTSRRMPPRDAPLPMPASDAPPPTHFDWRGIVPSDSGG
jgi:catechol 2,3-dioxygenase-like lactoylglutathione lyase family enzyme